MDFYSGLTLNQDKATKPQTVQIVRQGETTLYWFLLIHYIFIGFPCKEEIPCKGGGENYSAARKG